MPMVYEQGVAADELIARKVFKYGVFSGPFFSLFRLNTEIYRVNLFFGANTGKYATEKPPYLDTFHVVAKS